MPNNLDKFPVQQYTKCYPQAEFSAPQSDVLKVKSSSSNNRYSPYSSSSSKHADYRGEGGSSSDNRHPESNDRYSDRRSSHYPRDERRGRGSNDSSSHYRDRPATDDGRRSDNRHPSDTIRKSEPESRWSSGSEEVLRSAEGSTKPVSPHKPYQYDSAKQENITRQPHGGAEVNLKQPESSSIKSGKKKMTVASVFNCDDSEDEEEIPVHARMRMRNIGLNTPTSSGPNSFGKTKRGFTDTVKMWDKDPVKLAKELAKRSGHY